MFRFNNSSRFNRLVACLLLAGVVALAACGAGSGSDVGTQNGSNTVNNSGTSNDNLDGGGQTGASAAASGNTNGSPNGTATGTGSGNGAGAGTPTNLQTPPTTPPSTPPTGTVSAESYTITVYYTAVESFHSTAAQTVTGCLIRACSFGNSVIGSYPASFIKATKTEGTGRITSGANAGKYLNWSVDVGYWLDTIPSDGYGGALVPFRTAAADAIALPKGAQFRLVAPLKQEDGSALDATSANRLLAATWLINDQFTPGLGGALHLDVYIGEEDRVNFTNTSPLYTTLSNVKISRL